MNESGWSQYAVSSGVSREVTGLLPLGRSSSGVQPWPFAMRSPARLGSPAVRPSAAWPSGKPARMRDACFQVHSRGAPRVGWMPGAPDRSPSTRSRADCGVMLSKNSQFTITTGA